MILHIGVMICWVVIGNFILKLHLQHATNLVNMKPNKKLMIATGQNDEIVIQQMQAAVKVVAAWHFTVSLRRGESVETGANRQLLAVQYSLSVSR